MTSVGWIRINYGLVYIWIIKERTRVARHGATEVERIPDHAESYNIGHDKEFVFTLFFFFWWYWGLNSGPALWATLPALFCDGFFFRDRVSRTICRDWLWTAILLISASWVTRITGVDHQCPTCFYSWNNVLQQCLWAIFPLHSNFNY
jgi:hypothetical protein